MAMSFNALKRNVITNFPKHTYKFVTDQYPEWKQFSDQCDLNFWVSWLINKSYDKYTRTHIENFIYENISDYMTGKQTWEDILDKIPDDSDHNYEFEGQTVPERFAWEQIGKSSLRQGWLQQIKEVFARSMARFELAKTPEELHYEIQPAGSKKQGMFPLLPTI